MFYVDFEKIKKIHRLDFEQFKNCEGGSRFMSCFAIRYLLDAIAPHLVESIVCNNYSINVFEINNIKYVMFES